MSVAVEPTTAKVKVKMPFFAVGADDLPAGHPLAKTIDDDFADMDRRRKPGKALFIGFIICAPMWATGAYFVGKAFRLF